VVQLRRQDEGKYSGGRPTPCRLEELRGRLNARVAAVEKRLRLLQGEFEKLALERIELRAELHVLEEQMQKSKDEY
jgi:hypothetical protein